MPVLQPRATVRFGLFELDLQARELHRGGMRIRLAPQPFDLLTALLEQPGTVVSRDVLQQRLWPPNTFVDYEQGLNKTVRKLREALGDSAESPRYIETVQKNGYRFIAPVIAVSGTAPDPISAEASADPASGVLPVHSRPAMGRQRVFAWLATCLAFAASLAGLAWGRHVFVPRAGDPPQSRGVDPRAQDAYLHGRYLWFGEHALASSDYFKRAVELQPDYAAAWAGLSSYYGAALARGRLDPAEGLALQSDAAARAVRFGPRLSEAHLAMCGSVFFSTWQYQAANVECTRALELDPNNAEVYHLRSKMQAALDRPEEALATQRTGSRLDPLSRPWALGQALLQARHYDAALSEVLVRLESFPHDATLLRLLADTYRARGNEVEAAKYLEQSFRYGGDEPSATQVNAAFRRGGVHAVAQWQLERLLRQSTSAYVSPYGLALAYAQLGDREHALPQLAKAFDEHSTDLLWIRCEPAFDSLRSDPRFQALLARLPTP